MEKSLDLDLTDGEYLILDTVAKDINMIQLLDKIPKNRLEKLLKYCTKHCNSYVFSNYMKYGMLKLNLPNVYVMLYSKLYNKKYNIMVYLFGENHTQENLCKTSILKELYQKLDKVPYLVDVFTEIGRNDKKKGGSYVIDQIHKFHKESKNMTNVRSHEINIRSVENMEEIYKELYSTDGVSFSIEKLKTLQEKLPKDMIDKIQKQIDNMYDPKYKKIMQSYLDSTVKALNQLREDVYNNDKCMQL